MPITLIAILSCEEDKGDTSPPEVSIISPLNGSTVNEITNLNVSATDNEEVDFVRFFINDSLDSSLVSAEPYSYAWNTNKLDDGQYNLSVMAQDASGNTSDTIEAVYTVDNTISIPAAIEIAEIRYGLNLMSIRFNKSHVGDKYERISRSMGLPESSDLAEIIENLNSEIGLPQNLGEMGIVEDMIPGLAQHSVVDICSFTNPVIPTLEDYEKLFVEAIG